MSQCCGEDVIERMRQERMEAEERFAADPHRPRYHFLPPANWMNDPNGPIWFDGRYHLFYQLNPDEAKWGNIHWGHAVSGDLIHWEDWPIALAPETEGIDTSGCFSGCAFVQEDGTPTLAYTGVPTTEGKKGVRSDNQSLAVNHDRMLTWEKIPQNPVIAGPPEELDVVGFRDPCVWREGDTWYMLVGSGLEGPGGGTALLYRSQDLLDWEYLHPLTVGDPDEHGGMWECPDFFPLGERHALLVSALGRQMYLTGGWSGEEFTPGAEGWLDHGPSFYAGKSFECPHGRRILWGWLREARELPAQLAAGWSGVMSLPRVLGMLPDGRISCHPAGEVERLRGEGEEHEDADLGVGKDLRVEMTGRCLEIDLEARLDPGARLVVSVLRSPGAEEATDIYYDSREERVGIDTGGSSLDPTAETRDSSGPLSLKPDEPLRLRIFVDRSVVEVFANRRACVTERAYPSRPDSVGLRIAAEGRPVSVRRLNVWQMRSIWRSAMRSSTSGSR
jgi:beta-fructofuranosidase